jgi:hypothetical protein
VALGGGEDLHSFILLLQLLEKVMGISLSLGYTVAAEAASGIESNWRPPSR